MKKQSSMVLKTTVAAILGLSMASAAHAVTFGDGGVSLQDVLDDVTVSGAGATSSDPFESDVGIGDATTDISLSSVNVNTDQISDGLDSIWTISGSGGSFSQIIIEIASFADGNVMGIYDATNKNATVDLFGGSAVQGDQATLSFVDNLDGTVSVWTTFTDISAGTSTGGDTGVDFAGNAFGYFLEVNEPGYENTWYSNTGFNVDGEDHMVAYQGPGGEYIDLPSTATGEWADNEYIIAWEDLHQREWAGWGPAEPDFTDFVFIAESVTPIPEPSILALLGLGLLGFAGTKRLSKA